MLRVALLLATAGVGLTFAPSAYLGRKGAYASFDRHTPLPHARAAQARRAPAMCSDAASVPSWEDIQAQLGPEAAAADPMLTLYRDNNGWCPFCERVWLALLAKGIPFEEKTLSLQNKPQWYLDKVPTGLVPAIELKGSNEVVFESRDILMRLESDDRFSNFRTLLPSAETDRATKLLDDLDGMAKGLAGVLYGTNVTADELDAKVKAFDESMGKIEGLLQDSSSSFFLSTGFSVVDCMIVPILERLSVQLPLKTGIQLRDRMRWPAVDDWFVAMESEVAPYRNRVQGDCYSWSASFVTILEMFQATGGVGGHNPITNAQHKARHVLDEQLAASPSAFDEASRNAALRKLVANHAGIVADATSEAKTQKSVERLTDADASLVDLALRRAASILLTGDDLAAGSLLQGVTPTEAQAARLVASRLCVPRDMGAPAAGALRASLGCVALAP